MATADVALLDVLRLEVDATELTNQVTNHSGQTGNANGWITDGGVALAVTANPVRDGQTLQRTFSPGGRALRATVDGSAGAGFVRSPEFPVTPGEWVGVALSFADTLASAGSRLQIDLVQYSSTGTVLGRRGAVYRATTQGSPWRMTDITYPPGLPGVGTVTMRVEARLLDGDNLARRQWLLAKLMVIIAPTRAQAAGVTFATENWQQILGSALSARINRGGDVDGVEDRMDVGTLTAVVRDAMYDPTLNARIRPGRAVRLTASFDGGAVYRPLMTGRLREANVSYSRGKLDRDQRPDVSLVVSDLKATAESEPSPYTYVGTYAQKARALIANATAAFPYVTDTGSASGTRLSAIQGATLWQQLQLAANSFPNAKLYVDAAGVLRAQTFGVTTPAATVSDLLRTTLVNRQGNPGAELGTPLLTPSNTSTTVARSSVWSISGTYSHLVSLAALAHPAIVQIGTVPVDPTISTVQYAAFRITLQAARAGYFQVGSDQCEAYAESAVLAAGQVVTLTGTGRILPGQTSARFDVTFQATESATGTQFRADEVAVYGPQPFNLVPVPYLTIDSPGAAYVGAVGGPVAIPYTLPSSASYSEIDTVFGSRALVNSLTLTRTHPTESDGEKVYGPFVAPTSVQQWGSVKASIETVDGDPTTLATDYLQRYASPSVFPQMVRFNALEVDAWAAQLAALDLYSGVRVIMTRAALDKTVVLLAIEHEITPSGWWVTWRFRPADVLTSVPVTNQSGPGLGPADVVPPPAGILHARRLDGAQSIANNQWSGIDLNSLLVSNGGITYNTTERAFTVPRRGRYQINAGIRWNAAAGGSRQLRILRNGSNVEALAALSDMPASPAPTQSLSRVVYAAPGDVFAVQVLQASGAALSLTGLASGNYVDVTWLGD